MKEYYKNLARNATQLLVQLNCICKIGLAAENLQRYEIEPKRDQGRFLALIGVVGM